MTARQSEIVRRCYLKENDFAGLSLGINGRKCPAMHATTKPLVQPFHLTDATYSDGLCPSDFAGAAKPVTLPWILVPRQGPLSRGRLGYFVRKPSVNVAFDCVKNKGFESR